MMGRTEVEVVVVGPVPAGEFKMTKAPGRVIVFVHVGLML
jgi:hypothetical protein